MKTLFFLTVLISAIACAVSKKNILPSKKLEIIKIDTTTDFYIFKTIDDSNREVTVLAAKDRIIDCKPFKRFIIADSIHQTTILESGSKTYLAYHLGKIDGIEISQSGQLPKIIKNCNCFTDN